MCEYLVRSLHPPEEHWCACQTVGSLVEGHNDVHLVCQGRAVSRDALVSEALEEGATLEISADLLGGGKKRKKKTYTKPKKIKRKHKKVKLAVLKFYTVNDQMKITRNRKESPIGGPGVFMAKHHNRYTCGKSGLTYLFKDDE